MTNPVQSSTPARTQEHAMPSYPEGQSSIGLPQYPGVQPYAGSQPYPTTSQYAGMQSADAHAAGDLCCVIEDLMSGLGDAIDPDRMRTFRLDLRNALAAYRATDPVWATLSPEAMSERQAMARNESRARWAARRNPYDASRGSRAGDPSYAGGVGGPSQDPRYGGPLSNDPRGAGMPSQDPRYAGSPSGDPRYSGAPHGDPAAMNPGTQPRSAVVQPAPIAPLNP